MPRKPVLHPAVWPFESFRYAQDAFVSARQLANSRQPLSLITAEAGEGKTFSAEYFASANPDTKIAVCPPRELLTTRSLLVAVARAVGMTNQPIYATRLFEALVSYLSREQLFLVVDEADRLTSSKCDLLRELAEQSDTAICFLGCPGVQSVLARVPATHHRIGFAFAIPPVRQDDLQQALTGFDAETIAEIYNQTRGNIRHLEALLGLVAKLRGTGDKKPVVTPAIIRRLANRFLMKGAA